MRLDYNQVPIELSDGALHWFQSHGGSTWFQEIDPFLQAVRQACSGDVAEVMLYRAPDTGLLYAKHRRRSGGEGQQAWMFAFDPKGNTFKQVQA